MVGNSSLFIYNCFQQLFSKCKPGMANIVCKYFLFQIEKRKIVTEAVVCVGLTDQAAPDKLIIPHNRLSWFHIYIYFFFFLNSRPMTLVM